jgi:hypothetical protein
MLLSCERRRPSCSHKTVKQRPVEQPCAVLHLEFHLSRPSRFASQLERVVDTNLNDLGCLVPVWVLVAQSDHVVARTVKKMGKKHRIPYGSIRHVTAMRTDGEVFYICRGETQGEAPPEAWEHANTDDLSGPTHSRQRRRALRHWRGNPLSLSGKSVKLPYAFHHRPL